MKIGIFGSVEKSKDVLMHLSWIGGFNKSNLLATVEKDVYFVDDKGNIASMTYEGFKSQFNCEPYTIDQWQDIYNNYSVLHKEIVENVIKFCKTYNLNITDFKLGADGINKEFYNYGWHPGIDSFFRMQNGKDIILNSL